MSKSNSMVKHVFVDRETSKIYPFWTTREDQQKILTDKKFALEIFESAKKYYIEQSSQKDSEEENKNYQSEDITIIDSSKDYDDVKSEENKVKISSKDDYDDVQNNLEEDKNLCTEDNVKLEENKVKLDNAKRIKRKMKFASTNKKKSLQYVWQYLDTKALISSYGAHRNESYKKKFWDIIANDLVSQHYKVNSELCQAKWNKLLRFYKISKDKIGRGPSKFVYLSEMDEIFGKKKTNNEKSDDEDEKKEKYVWQYNDTKALIYSYRSHMDELDHPKDKKHVWSRIADDLNSQNYNVDRNLCQIKWNNLLRTYKHFKDKIVDGPTRFMFVSEMDEIFSDKPSLAYSFRLSQKPLFQNEQNNSIVCSKEDDGVNEKLDVKVETFTSSFSSIPEKTDDDEKKERYAWQYNDTKALISSYKSHLDLLHHPSGKKKFWNKIANDLISQNYNVDRELCQSKWNNLLRTYKQSKDKTRRPSRFLFVSEMDDVFANKIRAFTSWKTGTFPNVKAEDKEESKKRKHSDDDDEDRKEREERKLEIQRKKLELEEKKLSFEKTKCDLIKQYLEIKRKEANLLDNQ